MKKFIVCLMILALAGTASARIYYSDGGVHNFTTQTHESIGIENGTTINIGNGVVVTLTREANYSTSYVGSYYGTGPTNYLNLSGNGQLTFSQEMALSLADGTEPGTVTMTGTSYMNPSGLAVGQRGDSLFSITDDATLELRADGTLYTPNFRVGNNHYGYDLTGTFDQSGNATVLSVGSGLDLGGSNTGIYNMSGGTLTLGGAITIGGADDAFNFSGGTITLKGANYLPWDSTQPQFNVLGAPYSETFDGTDTILYIPVKKALDIDPTSVEVYEDPLEGPQSATFTVAIDPDPGVKPGQVVTIVVDPNGQGDSDIDVTVNPGTLTFTNADWATPQTVTVTAIGNDDVCDGGFAEQDLIALKVSAVGGDPNDFVGADDSVSVTIFDYECANIVISTTAVSVTEGGATDTYTIEVTSAPTDPVTITVGAVDLVPASETDPNLVPGPLPCQVTVNGTDMVDLVFDSGNWETAQTITVAAFDDSLYEPDPHSYVIGHHLFTDDVTYGAMSVPNVTVTITENDFRSWSFGDDDDLTSQVMSNPSFESPVLADGGVFNASTSDPVPGYGQWGDTSVVNPDLGAGEWDNRYNVGHRSVPDGDQVLTMHPTSPWTWVSPITTTCDYVVEDGPVSYTFKASIGVAKEDDGQGGYALHPDAGVRLIFEFDPPDTWLLQYELGYDDLIPYEGEWIEIEGCLDLPAGHPSVGGEFQALVLSDGGHVDVDNLRVIVGNHPCDGCYQDNYPDGDVTGPDGVPDCNVDLLDLAFIAADWLKCNLYPDCVTSW